MNKLLLTTLLLGVFVVFGVQGVVAQQNVTVDVNGTASMTIIPDVIDFGSTLPNISVTLLNGITFSATAESNQDLNIAITEVTGIFSGENLRYRKSGTGDSLLNLDSLNVNMPCNSPDGNSPCNYTDIILDLVLNIPMGTPAGVKNGVITYTLSGTTPGG
jgi:hypothetical protein